MKIELGRRPEPYSLLYTDDPKALYGLVSKTVNGQKAASLFKYAEDTPRSSIARMAMFARQEVRRLVKEGPPAAS